MEPRYASLLSPLQIPGTNVVLKNRMNSSNAIPHFLQGPQNFPDGPMVTHYANIARLDHDVTVLTRQGTLAHYATPLHHVEHLI